MWHKVSISHVDLLTLRKNANSPLLARHCVSSTTIMIKVLSFYVLRDLGEDVSDHFLVGPCYIHGLMDGQAVKDNPAFSDGTIQLI